MIYVVFAHTYDDDTHYIFFEALIFEILSCESLEYVDNDVFIPFLLHQGTFYAWPGCLNFDYTVQIFTLL